MNELLEETSEDPSPMLHGQGRKGLGRILIVDDDESIRLLVTEILSRSGFEVDGAEDGARAWRALQLKRYDLLITDQDMPEMTGLQLVYRIRLAGFELPVVFASGRAASDLMTKEEWLGLVATFLPKPFTLHELVRTVSGLLPVTDRELNIHPWQLPSNPTLRQENHPNR